MARLALLDEDVDPPDEARATSNASALTPLNDDRPNPNLNQFSAALSCYPIASQLARSLDLTALHELSRTCRQVRANLLQYRKQLIARALRCENETLTPALRLGNALQDSHDQWTARGPDGMKIRRITGGKVGACARDLVGECRRCGTVVCRNCVIKAPPSNALKARHRRLCRTCVKSPLEQLTRTSASASSGPEEPLEALDLPFPFPEQQQQQQQQATPPSPPLAREPCTCPSAGVWLCQPCGTTTRPADTTYLRGWTWRTRYSACGGMGAGLGEGNEGVECGRRRACAAARLVEKDVECDPAELAALVARSGVTAAAAADDDVDEGGPRRRGWEGGSYATQEIVGIGGKVKKRVRKLVPVGAIVKEYEDERVSEVFLEREQSGVDRSWCSWCERVVLGEKDVEAGKGSRESVGSASSMGSVA